MVVAARRAPVVVLVARVLVVLWLGWVAWASLAPSSDVPGADISDKVLHVAAYAVLALLGTLALRPPRPVLVFVVALAIGGLLEVLQGASGYRDLDPQDLLADALGALAGVLVGLALSPRGDERGDTGGVAWSLEAWVAQVQDAAERFDERRLRELFEIGRRELGTGIDEEWARALSPTDGTATTG